MKTIKGAALALAAIVLSVVKSLAVDGLQISAQSSDIVLSWPSTPGQTYLILYTKSITPPVQWTVLATGYLAADNTNQTTFIHSGELATAAGGAGSFAAMTQGVEGFGAASTDDIVSQQEVPLVKRADGSGGTSPLSLYPSGFDFSDFLIYDPSTTEWINGSQYSQAETSAGMPIFAAFGDPTPNAEDGTNAVDTITNNCGFYEVFGVTATGGITNNSSVSDYIQSIAVRPEMGAQYLQLLVDGQPYPGQDALVPPFTNALSLDSIDTARLANGSHTLQVEAVYQVPDPGSEGLHHVLSQPFQVNVFNELSFPDWDNMTEDAVCGFDIVSAHQVVDWEIDVYDIYDYIAWVNGQIPDIYPIHVQTGSTTNGLIQYDWNLTDDLGNPRNDPNSDPYFVSFTYTQWSGASQSSGGGAVPNAGGSASTGNPLKKQPPKWPSLGSWVVSFQHMFRHYYDQNNWLSNSFIGMLNMGNLPDTPPFWKGPLGGTNAQTFPVRYYYNRFRSDLNPTNNDYYQGTLYDQDLLTKMLLDPRARNFFYYGHGSQEWICSSIYSKLLVDYGMHRYRFVWLDGCETGSGSWPDTFGIHGPGLFTLDYYQERSKRPGLFIGNKYSVPLGIPYDDQTQVGGVTYDGYIPRVQSEFYNQFIFYWKSVGHTYKQAFQETQDLVEGAYPTPRMSYLNGPRKGATYWPGDDQIRVGYEEMQYNRYNYDYDVPTP